jgi:glycosyltransferase involved in cell wall biosynthesis
MSEFENLPNIIIEAQSLGVPVVALDRGGVSETILVGETGYVLKDESEFHYAMSWFLAASKEPNFKNRIRSFAKARFDQVKIANKYLEVYSR